MRGGPKCERSKSEVTRSRNRWAAATKSTPVAYFAGLIFLIPIGGCAPEFEVPLGGTYYFGWCAVLETGQKPRSTFCVLEGDPRTSLSVEVRDVVAAACANGVVFGRTDSKWFLLTHDDTRWFTEERAWRDVLTGCGIQQFALQKPPTRLDAVLANLRQGRTSEVAGLAIVPIVVTGCLVIIVRRRARKQ